MIENCAKYENHTALAILFSAEALPAYERSKATEAGEPPRFFVAGGPQPDTPARRQELLEELLIAADHSPEEAKSGEIRYHESGQPYAGLRASAEQAAGSYPLSISHCSSFLAIALSARPEQRIGLDVESAGRNVHPALRRRISSTKARNETHHPEHQIPDLRLWTLKEAFLKMGGSGLRVPMREVEIWPEGALSAALSYFSARSTGHHARLYSFQREGIMIAVSIEMDA